MEEMEVRGLLQQFVQATELPSADIETRGREIHGSLLRDSPYLDGSNFTRLHVQELRRMFNLYDRTFFGGRVQAALDETPLHFRLSPRMTSAGGKTTRYHPTRNRRYPYYVISVSTTLLFQSFQDASRPIVVTGRVCQDRLEALQRVFEHELVHLIEMLLWTDSSCSADRFQSMALRIFGHTDHRHELITPRERAWTKYGVRPGDRVRFRFDGTTYVGMVNRIHKRATVLVEDLRGASYTDGKRYAKFYVPLDLLEPLAKSND
jgi:hypothetical protein